MGFFNKNSKFSYVNNYSSVIENCKCYTCKNYSKAYLQHLRNTKEILAYTLLVM